MEDRTKVIIYRERIKDKVVVYDIYIYIYIKARI